MTNDAELGPDSEEIIDYLGVQLLAPPSIVSDTILGFIRRGTYEKREALAVSRLIEPGEILLELGAGIGLISTVAAKHPSKPEVIAYEANPSLLGLLRENHQLNSVEVVSVGAAAVPDVERRSNVPFKCEPDFWGSAVVSGDPGRSVEIINVPAVRFSSLLAQHRPTFLVIDIEGGEDGLFEGISMPTVRKILIEMHVELIGATGVASLFSALGKHGFGYDVEHSSGSVVSFKKLL